MSLFFGFLVVGVLLSSYVRVGQSLFRKGFFQKTERRLLVTYSESSSLFLSESCFSNLLLRSCCTGPYQYRLFAPSTSCSTLPLLNVLRVDLLFLVLRHPRHSSVVSHSSTRVGTLGGGPAGNPFYRTQPVPSVCFAGRQMAPLSVCPSWI